MENKKLKNFLKKIKLNETTISTILGILVVIVVGVLIFNYFKGVGREKKEALPAQTTNEIKLIEEQGQLIPEGLPTTYKVQKGDNLWKIADKFYGSGYNWVDIVKENKIKNSNILFVDQELTIPRMAVKKPATEVAQVSQNLGSPITTNSYTVVKGDNLWKIAVLAFGDGYQWVKIARENNLKNPNLIHPGNILKLSR